MLLLATAQTSAITKLVEENHYVVLNEELTYKASYRVFFPLILLQA